VFTGDSSNGNTYSSDFLDAMDVAVFKAPFIIIDSNNKAIAKTGAIAKARLAVASTAEAASIVGQLRDGIIGVDIDPSDTRSSSSSGEAVGDDLVAWLEHYGLPWCRRLSGRPGHIHIVALVPDPIRSDFYNVVRAAGKLHEVSATARSSLRILTAPHRLGLPSPVLDGTFLPSDIAPRGPGLEGQSVRSSTNVVPLLTRHRAMSESRSEGEFGDALAHARSGWASTASWAAANVAGSKARQIGRIAWQRWFWAPATTIVAAENRASEYQAWRVFQCASPVQADRLGQCGWRTRHWLPALEEAKRDRPRRLGPHRAAAGTVRTGPSRQVLPHQERRIDQLRQAALRSVDDLVRGKPTLPERIRPSSLRATLYALAEHVVLNAGAVSIRTWAETARLDPKTVRKARDAAHQLGLIRKSRAYNGKLHDSDAWLLAEKIVTPVGHKKSTGDDSPTLYTPTYGMANVEAMRRRHVDERLRWQQKLYSEGLSMFRTQHSVAAGTMDTSLHATLGSASNVGVHPRCTHRNGLEVGHGRRARDRCSGCQLHTRRRDADVAQSLAEFSRPPSRHLNVAAIRPFMRLTTRLNRPAHVQAARSVGPTRPKRQPDPAST
jgi:hypothetical protein